MLSFIKNIFRKLIRLFKRIFKLNRYKRIDISNMQHWVYLDNNYDLQEYTRNYKSIKEDKSE